MATGPNDELSDIGKFARVAGLVEVRWLRMTAVMEDGWMGPWERWSKASWGATGEMYL